MEEPRTDGGFSGACPVRRLLRAEQVRAEGATWRDVIILDECNEVFAVYDLTSNDLGMAENRPEPSDLLRAAAGLP